MNKTIIIFTIFFCFAITGCKRNIIPDQKPQMLNKWLLSEAFPKIIYKLKHSSFCKDMQFIIMKSKEDEIINKIDDLTRDVRSRLIDYILEHPEIKIVLKHSLIKKNLPYKIKNLEICDHLVEYNAILTISITNSGHQDSNLVNVRFRALDINKGSLIPGFSIHNDDKKIAISNHQKEKLNRPEEIDETLRGLRELPFTTNQFDKLTEYLALNLTCMFRQESITEETSIFISHSKIDPKYKIIVELLKKQIPKYNQIQIVTRKENAVWWLFPETLCVGTNSGLYQVWLSLNDNKNEKIINGVTTCAYLKDITGASIIGKWKICSIPDKQEIGLLNIYKVKNGLFIGTLFSEFSENSPMVKQCIEISLKENNVAWSYYNPDSKESYEYSGILEDNKRQMFVKTKVFPSKLRQISQELILID